MSSAAVDLVLEGRQAVPLNVVPTFGGGALLRTEESGTTDEIEYDPDNGRPKRCNRSIPRERLCPFWYPHAEASHENNSG